MSTILVNNVKSYTGSTVTISGSNIAVQGNTTLGDGAGTDTITVNGHITASGDISASGTIFASKFESAGTSNEVMSFNDNLNITGNITASGDISASGTITAEQLTTSDDLTVGDDLSLNSDSSVFNMGAGNDFTITHDGTTGAVISATPITINSVGELELSGSSIDVNSNGVIAIDSVGLSIDSTGVAANITSTTDGGSEDFTIALAGATDSSLILSSTGTGADALQITTTAGGIDISATGNAAGEDVDISSAASVNVTATEDAANAIYLRANGGTSETIKIHSDQGTGAGSVELTSDAGSIDINAGDNITVDAADDIIVTTTSADGELVLSSSHTAGRAIHIRANANAGSIVDIDAGILDIDVTGAATIDSVGLSIDNAGVAANITSTSDGAAEDFTIALAGATDSSLILSSTGTGADALQISTTAGGIDITATGNAAGEDIDISSAASVNVTATEDAANAIYLRANGGTSETIKIHSDQGTGAGSVELTSDAGSIDINAGDNITMDAADNIILTTTSADGELVLSSSHTAGRAIHIDGNTAANSQVVIDAGILDINVTSHISLDADIVQISGSSGIAITGSVTAPNIQSPATALTATDAGVTIPAGTAVALINADSDADHIVILPAPVVGNIIHIIETATTGYELRTSTPGSIGINGGTGSNAESAIAGAITYIRCVCVSSTSWIATQFDADGDESKVEAAA